MRYLFVSGFHSCFPKDQLVPAYHISTRCNNRPSFLSMLSCHTLLVHSCLHSCSAPLSVCQRRGIWQEQQEFTMQCDASPQHIPDSSQKDSTKAFSLWSEERSEAQRRSSASFAENENKTSLSKNMSSSCCCFVEDEEEELARQVAKCCYVQSTEDCQFCSVVDHHRYSSANCELIPFSFAEDQQCVYGTNEERQRHERLDVPIALLA